MTDAELLVRIADHGISLSDLDRAPEPARRQCSLGRRVVGPRLCLPRTPTSDTLPAISGTEVLKVRGTETSVGDSNIATLFSGGPPC